jgi:hypothetical protein
MAPSAECQEKERKKNPLLKILDNQPRGGFGQPAPLSFDVATGVGSVLGNGGKKSGLFDAYYVDGLQRMQVESMIGGNPNDIDQDKQANAGQRALTMKIGQTINSVLTQSDLRDSYRSALRSFQQARESVKVSVQHDQQGYAIGRKQKGPKVLELDVEPSTQTGLAPQLKFYDEAARMRYDQNRKAIMFEFRCDW